MNIGQIKNKILVLKFLFFLYKNFLNMKEELQSCIHIKILYFFTNIFYFKLFISFNVFLVLTIFVIGNVNIVLKVTKKNFVRVNSSAKMLKKYFLQQFYLIRYRFINTKLLKYFQLKFFFYQLPKYIFILKVLIVSLQI